MTMGEDKITEFSPSGGEEKRWHRFAWLLYPFMKVSFLPFGGEVRFRRKIVAFAKPEKGESVLDACCGAGEMTRLIAEKVGNTGRITGIDISETAIREALDKIKEGLPLTFRQASCAAIPFRDRIFDRVFISFGLHEMSEADRPKSLGEVKRVLKDYGSLFVLEYNMPKSFFRRFVVKAFSWLFESEGAYRMLIDGALFQYLEQAGFSIRRRQTLGADIFQILHVVKTSVGQDDA